MSRPEDMPVTTDQRAAPATFSLAPTTLEEAWDYAKILSETEMVPKDFKGKPGNVLVAIQMGAELGLPPTQALQNIAVINGRPALWGDAVLALVKGKADFDYIDEIQEGDVAICKIKRRGQPEVVRTFSQDDAKKAQLAGKQGPWTQYPQRMRQMRARSWAIRDCYPDALKGISVVEEARDIPERNITPAPAPSQPGESRTEALKNTLAKPAAKPEQSLEAEVVAEKKPAPKKKPPAKNSPDDIPSIDRFKMISEAIRVAATTDALALAIGDVDLLGEDHKKDVRIQYRYRLGVLRKEPVRMENGHVTNAETGEIIL
ncbi:hypothetical protein N9J88_06970 [Porticoccaceae bacterium]|nr:hypothetical protein [Porticoccaceae bacterium]